MRLVFIHGWGFEAGFWDGLAGLLPQFRQRRVDLGFFGEPADFVEDETPSLLVGHSLGFVHGMRSGAKWAGWVAINSFPRFVATDTEAGCVPAAALRGMRRNLMSDPQRTLYEFYSRIGATPPALTTAPQLERLRDGLDELRDADSGAARRASHKPGLVLAAQNDPLVPCATSEALVDSHAQIRWHADGGHMLPLNAAPWCAEAIMEFIKTHFGEEA
jgi:pimeloyl-ACP methyl ester carboxylesterase